MCSVIFDDRLGPPGAIVGIECFDRPHCLVLILGGRSPRARLSHLGAPTSSGQQEHSS